MTTTEHDHDRDVRRIADAVLYEGYILYPYRPSVKNRQRWTFGGLCPEAYCRAAGDGSSSANRTECLLRGTAATAFDARVRFLHLTDRRVGAFEPPLADWADGRDAPAPRRVAALRAGDALYQEWQEAEEREVELGAVTLGELSVEPARRSFAFPDRRTLEPVRDGGAVVGVLERVQEGVAGEVEASAVEVAAGLYRVSLRVSNRTPMDAAADPGRDAAALRSMASTHAVLTAARGAFVSLADPPEADRAAAAACTNAGAWPVLVGEPGSAVTMLSAPIILYDYPQVAPESAGDFFDGTEMDEMLTLRIMTLTDDEKGAMASVDRRARALLARTEGTGHEQMMGLHGTIRDLRPVPADEKDDARV